MIHVWISEAEEDGTRECLPKFTPKSIGQTHLNESCTMWILKYCEVSAMR
jgi:hypothetical protein